MSSSAASVPQAMSAIYSQDHFLPQNVTTSVHHIQNNCHIYANDNNNQAKNLPFQQYFGTGILPTSVSRQHNTHYTSQYSNFNTECTLTLSSDKIKTEKRSPRSCLNGFRETPCVRNVYLLPPGQNAEHEVKSASPFTLIKSASTSDVVMPPQQTNIEITRIIQPDEIAETTNQASVSLKNYSSTNGPTWTARHYFPSNQGNRKSSHTSTCIAKNTQSKTIENRSRCQTGMLLDDSLTNIGWLGKLSSGALNDSATTTSKSNSSTRQRTDGAQSEYAHKDMRRITSEKQIDKISKECGRDKRPPFSYMHLIQLAIRSSSDKRMTLKEIYKWIADKFPYYRYSARQGWKNSIRHNLSLYDIFVREKPKNDIPGQNSVSYWTLRPDVPSRPKASRQLQEIPTSGASVTVSVPMVPNHVPSLQQPFMIVNHPPNINTAANHLKTRPRKGPAPLLPKLPALQTFALIPIQGVMPVPAGTQASSSLNPPAAPPGVPIVNQVAVNTMEVETSRVNKVPLKRALSPTGTVNQRKHIKIAPKISTSDENIIGQAWNDATSTHPEGLNRDDHGSLASHTSCDSGLGFSTLQATPDVNLSLSVSMSRSNTEKGKLRSRKQLGKPRPKIYTKKCSADSNVSKENMTNVIETPRNSATKRFAYNSELHGDTSLSLSENGLTDILSNFERDFSSPMKSLLSTPPFKGEIKTSTPCKPAPHSPQWCSPIRGITPMASLSNVLDSGIYTPVRGCDNKSHSVIERNNSELSTPKFITFRKSRSHQTPPSNGSVSSRLSLSKLSSSPVMSSPKGFGLTGITPLKSTNGGNLNSSLHNHSLNKVFAEFHLDHILDAEDLPLDMANLSWSCLSNSMS